MGKEYELKYKANGAKLASLREKYHDFFAISMQTRYFDTPQRDLQQRRWTLRFRQENEKSVCGLKTPGKNLVRGEWEVENPDLEAGVKALCTMDVPKEFPGLVAKGLQEVCAAEFIRLAKSIRYKGCTVELALDQGAFIGKDTRQPFAEVEVELKQGSRADATEFARALAAEFQLEEETVSKFERAFALAEGE